MSASDPGIDRNPTADSPQATAHFLHTSARYLGLPSSSAADTAPSAAWLRSAGGGIPQTHHWRNQS